MEKKFPIDGFVAGPPRQEEAVDVGRLFYADMTSQTVTLSEDQATELASDVAEAVQKENPNAVCRVVRTEAENKPVGVILANFHWSVKFGGKALWIEELYVDPSYRRNGIGRALVEWILDYAEQHDVRGIDLEAYQGNTPASVLYRTMGFRRLGRERFYYVMGDS